MIRPIPFLLLLLGWSLMVSSCQWQRKLGRESTKWVKKNEVLQKHFTGWSVRDAETGDVLGAFNDDKYFTPASNTKLFTAHLALSLIDSTCSIIYQETADTLFFWGTGEPSLLFSLLSSQPNTIPFLQSSNKHLALCLGNNKTPRLGSGWPWDDYPYLYQKERTALPVFGNAITVLRKNAAATIDVQPRMFKDSMLMDPSLSGSETVIYRKENSNQWVTGPQIFNAKAFEDGVPILHDLKVTQSLWQEIIGKPITILPFKTYDATAIQTVPGVPLDSLLRPMLIESDNFLAEQLLMMASHEQLGALDVDELLAYAKSNIWSFLPDQPLVVDGSGLSRYNLLTPRTVSALLFHLRKQYGAERMEHLLPQGGKSGTLSNWYGGDGTPYIYAKTGTLRNNHCLSGYLVTAKGRTVIFSWMHNHYSGSSTAVKQQMAILLQQLHDTY